MDAPEGEYTWVEDRPGGGAGVAERPKLWWGGPAVARARRNPRRGRGGTRNAERGGERAGWSGAGEMIKVW
ncbi:hypothetical protein ACICHK_24715 [Streptomyces sp. AHU1]|uniref:hypothetical protein n=1 Tax=Streptomyces sp. AHU1 TaxID=3377215 RepID=UPI00387840A7